MPDEFTEANDWLLREFDHTLETLDSQHLSSASVKSKSRGQKLNNKGTKSGLLRVNAEWRHFQAVQA